MTSINVNRNLSDQFYRYKMPKLIAKVEGKGNGIKTVIVNMVEVAKALNRPPMYPTKYFGCILGAQVNCDLKNERYIVNGAHESNKLQDILDGFIQKYVLCTSCGNPETVISVSQKKGIISTSCKACGFAGTISTKDKLSTYILKYPPTAFESNTANSSLTQGKRGKRKGKVGKNGKKENGDQSKNGHNESDDGNNEEEDEDDGDWCEDTSEDAVAKRMEELSAGAKGLMLNDDMEKSSKERMRIFYDFLQKKKASNGENVAFDVQGQKDIVGEAERLDIRDKAILTICETLFDEKILQQIKTHRLLLLRFTAQNEKAQKYLLRGFELIIQLYKSQLISKVAHILKSFYDLDIIEENILIEWGSKASKKTVGKELAEEIHEKAAPFIKWLKEAEEEDSDEEDEEEEIEVVYDDRMRGTEIRTEDVKPQTPNKTIDNKLNVNNNNINNGKLAEETAGDEIDIDAI